jgi:hypothetical protein
VVNYIPSLIVTNDRSKKLYLHPPNQCHNNVLTLGFKKNGNCQKNFCQILLNFSSLKQPFRN